HLVSVRAAKELNNHLGGESLRHNHNLLTADAREPEVSVDFHPVAGGQFTVSHRHFLLKGPGGWAPPGEVLFQSRIHWSALRAYHSFASASVSSPASTRSARSDHNSRSIRSTFAVFIAGPFRVCVCHSANTYTI